MVALLLFSHPSGYCLAGPKVKKRGRILGRRNEFGWHSSNFPLVTCGQPRHEVASLLDGSFGNPVWNHLLKQEMHFLLNDCYNSSSSITTWQSDGHSCLGEPPHGVLLGRSRNGYKLSLLFLPFCHQKGPQRMQTCHSVNAAPEFSIWSACLTISIRLPQ